MRGGRAKFQIALIRCDHCGQGWQEASGLTVPVSAAAVARAECDAQWIGSLDSDAPARAHQDVTPSVARLVWRRDHARCRVPGCRSARGLEIHHIVARAAGGSHEANNLVLVCSACHQAHHAGLLTISGTGEALSVTRAPRSGAHVDANGSHSRHAAHARASDDVMRELGGDARAAVVGLGSSPAVARGAVDEVLGSAGDGDLASILRAALRRCMRR